VHHGKKISKRKYIHHCSGRGAEKTPALPGTNVVQEEDKAVSESETEYGLKSAAAARVAAELKFQRAMRRQFYRDAVIGRRLGLPIPFISVGIMGCLVFVYLAPAISKLSGPKMLLVTGIVTIAMLASGDIYELFRDRFEYKIFCPRYDRASQPAPRIFIGKGLGAGRAFIYIPLAPLLPMLAIWLLTRLDLVHFVEGQGLWQASTAIALVCGLFRMKGVPASFRSIFKFFRRIPGPDLHDE
jgi:hypothetical protein